jgi:hypothetical protein
MGGEHQLEATAGGLATADEDRRRVDQHMSPIGAEKVEPVTATVLSCSSVLIATYRSG